ncbi:UNVERIFIED_CONTAM: putative acetyl-CoA acetyltransferase, cytosolic 2 [Sesamum calycinum]|uniref:Acetyl-CoA acetyltransferase, cytosolic 2 n=1 Tax=Sesamum calycinum TaxID=2727403 RepID=A0AAW2Q678_9LAMI
MSGSLLKLRTEHDPITDPGKGTAPEPENATADKPKKAVVLDLGNGSQVLHMQRFISYQDSWKYFDYLDKNIPWTRPTITVFARSHLQPRDTCYVASEGLTQLAYSGYQPLAYSWDEFPPLKEILDLVHKALPGSSFNSLLLNRYKGGNDYKKPSKSVQVKSTGRNEGEPPSKRSKKLSSSDQHTFLLKHGSLLVMSGYTQRDWLHSVPKRAKAGDSVKYRVGKKAITFGLCIAVSLLCIDCHACNDDFFLSSDYDRDLQSSGMILMASVADDSIKDRDVCIVGVARTPMGSFLGSLSSLPATKLGSLAIECALRRAGVHPSMVQEVFFGNVLTANLGQAPARQAALGAGIPNSVICTTINKVCASGMKGVNDVVVAGGMESMSNAPKYIPTGRTGSRLGHDTIIDGMLKDGLWDVYNDFGMGVCAELCADQHNITREEQDSYAIKSFERGLAAESSGAFSWEIVPVEVSGGRGKPSAIVDKDEGLGKFDASKLRKLRPSFKEKGGSVTAGNASSISDGAAALVLVSGAMAVKLGLKVIARIRGNADAAQAPELFTTAPAIAIPKAISNSGLKASNIDFYEINEASLLNVHGGAVSLGHPIGCSGARILVTLLGVLRQKNGKFGVAGVCNGGGGASAVVLELINDR